VSFDDLVLFGDCQYLPHENGPKAWALHDSAQELLTTDSAKWGDEVILFRQRATRLRDCCARLTEIRHRPLFYALSRRLWELREELDLLLGYVRLKIEGGNRGAPLRSDFHLPGTYRGGLVPRLQRLLIQHADGTFTPARDDSARSAADTTGPIPI
jgi:hypothetical protein